MLIRLIRPTEHAALGAMTVQAYEEVEGKTLGTYEDELADVAGRASTTEVLVAVDGDRLLGGVTFVGDSENPHAEHGVDGAATIRHLAVDPAGWGRGVGRALTEACLARARTLGVGEIVLHSTTSMVTAHALYRSLGFTRAANLDWEVDGIVLLGFRLAL